MDQDFHFHPAWWLKNPHLQTIWAGLIRRRVHTPYNNERLVLPDGDFLDLTMTPDNGGPVVLVLHGLQGSIRSRYACGMLASLYNANFTGILMHFRGCSGKINNQARLYHSGETSDPRQVINFLQQRYPGRPLLAIGFSLGGNVLLKLLGEDDPVSLQAAVAVSVPLRLDYCADRINQGLSKLYQWNLVRSMKSTIRKKHAAGQLPTLDNNKTQRARSFWEIDDAFTAPVHGFKDVHDYYARCSSRQYLKNISTPTLIIQAKDDPFTSSSVIPEHHELSPTIQLVAPEYGGHVGFVYGDGPWKTRYWLEEVIPEFLKRQL